MVIWRLTAPCFSFPGSDLMSCGARSIILSKRHYDPRAACESGRLWYPRKAAGCTEHRRRCRRQRDGPNRRFLSAFFSSLLLQIHCPGGKAKKPGDGNNGSSVMGFHRIADNCIHINHFLRFSIAVFIRPTIG